MGEVRIYTGCCIRHEGCVNCQTRPNRVRVLKRGLDVPKFCTCWHLCAETATKPHPSRSNPHKVSLSKVVGDISVFAVEDCLLQQLPTLFISETVFQMDDDVIRTIAAESEQSVAERERSTVKLGVLETGLRDLSRLNSRPSKPGV